MGCKRALLLSVLLAAYCQAALAQAYSKPLTITDRNYGSGVFSGSWQSDDPTVAAVTVETTRPVTILRARLRGPGDLIDATHGGADLTVRETMGVGVNPNIKGRAKGDFLHGVSVARVLVENCDIVGTDFGVSIEGYAGGKTAPQTITVRNNLGLNMDGRYSDGRGGYSNLQGTGIGRTWSHFVQISNVYGVAGIEIAWNQVQDEPNASSVDDVVNIYSSSGTSASPIRIHDNYIQGAYGSDPTINNYTGGGIITDGSPNDTAATATAFVTIDDNQVVSTGNYGCAIAAGHDNTVSGNRIVSCGLLPNGDWMASTFGNGVYNWNCYGQLASVFFNDHVRGNLSGLMRRDSSGQPQRADYWLPALDEYSLNQELDHDPTPADEAAEFRRWLAKIKQNHQIIGPSLSE